MKALVTGGAGFIGSHLVDELLKKGHEVLVLDNLSTGDKENINPEADFKKVDIRERGKIKPLFEGVDYVFHLAALARVPLSVENPALTSEVNISGTVNVFESAKEAGVKRVVFASSSSVYGDKEELPYRETMQPDPISPYALQKWTGEKFANMFKDLYGFPVVSLRFFNVYGPRIDFDSDYSLVMGKFLKLKKAGKPLTIYGDGEQTRDFTYVLDVARGCIKAAESKRVEGGEVINIGSGNPISINKLADLISKEKKHFDKRPGDVLHTHADIKKAKDLLGWEPKVSFKEGLENTKEWFKKNYGE